MNGCVCVCAHSQTITQKAPAGEFESTFSILRQDHPDYTASENMPFCLRVFLQEVAVRFFVQKYDFSKSFSSIAHTRRHTRFTDKPEDEALRDVFITFVKRKQIFTICQTLAKNLRKESLDNRFIRKQ